MNLILHWNYINENIGLIYNKWYNIEILKINKTYLNLKY